MKAIFIFLYSLSSLMPIKDFLISSFLSNDEYNPFSYISIPFLDINKDNDISIGFIPRHQAYYQIEVEVNIFKYQSEIYYPYKFDEEIISVFNINKDHLISGYNNIKISYIYNEALLHIKEFKLSNKDHNTYDINNINYQYFGDIHSVYYKNNKYEYYSQYLEFVNFDKTIYLDEPVIDLSMFSLFYQNNLLFDEDSEIIISSKKLNEIIFNENNKKYFNVTSEFNNDYHYLRNNEIYCFDKHDLSYSILDNSSFITNKIYLPINNKSYEIDMRFEFKNITILNASFYLDVKFIIDPYFSFLGNGTYYVKVHNDSSFNQYDDMKEVYING